jgi:amino acid transporter
MLNPMICIIWCSQQANVFAPAIPYWGWALFFGGVFTFLNIQGIKTSARVNTLLAAGMGAVVAVFFMAAARYIFSNPHDGAAFFTRPFYDPQLWNSKAVLAATSIAVLSYIGFDGISTLSEEAENPRRNILLATVLTCFVIGILSALEVYGAQLLWPATQPFPNVDTAFTFVAGRAWKPLSDSRCWWPTSAPEWVRKSAPPVCSTAWDAARLCRNLSSEWSTRSGVCRATMFFSLVRSHWPARCW